VFEVASTDLVTMGIIVLSYTLKDIHDDEVRYVGIRYPDSTITSHFIAPTIQLFLLLKDYQVWKLLSSTFIST